jgi:hypothetical protein
MDTDVVMASAAIGQVVLTGVLALVVSRSTNMIARLEFSRSVRDAWVSVDELALANEATLKEADGLLLPNPAGAATVEFARKRWFILAYLNPINTTYQGVQDGIYGAREDEILAGIRAQLRVLLADEDAYWVSQHHGHDKSFRDFCAEVRRAVAAPAVPDA